MVLPINKYLNQSYSRDLPMLHTRIGMMGSRPQAMSLSPQKVQSPDDQVGKASQLHHPPRQNILRYGKPEKKPPD